MLDRSETLCPTTGEICPALVNLQNLYVGNADRVEPDIASDDRDIYTAKRLEYLGAATLRRCAGVTDADTCPTREAMDASRVRRSLVNIFRKRRKTSKV